MAGTIQHRGVVERIEGARVFVKVERGTACQACHAKGLCGEQGEDRIIEVRTPYASTFERGERVVVALLKTKMGYSSVIWAYVLPLVVLMAVLLGSHALGATDGLSALLSILAVAVYYVVIYIMRRRFDRMIEFTIIKE
jgi:sigma-E factor negative regulatory protein RseC